MICTFLERGESYLTYNQSFIKIGPKLRDLWDHLSPKIFKKVRVREALSDILGLFYYQFPTDCHDLYILERGESYLTYNQSFIKIGPKLRDLWDHLLPKLFKKVRVREAFV